MVVLGDKEAENETVTVRSRKEGDLGTKEFSAFLKELKMEINTKAR